MACEKSIVYQLTHMNQIQLIHVSLLPLPYCEETAGVEEVRMMQSCSTLHRWNLTAVAIRKPSTRLHLWTLHKGKSTNHKPMQITIS